MTTTASITIGELEANYQLYCKALKMLIAEKRTLNKIQRTVCWARLQTLHHCLPRRYKAPEYLYAQLQRDFLAPAAPGDGSPRGGQSRSTGPRVPAVVAAAAP